MVETDERMFMSQKDQFLAQGYTVRQSLIPEALILGAKMKARELQEDQPDWAHETWQVLDPKRKSNGKGQPLPVGMQRASVFEEEFRAIAHHPNLIKAMEEILGGEVTLHTDQLVIKHGFIHEEQGGRSYYHQDSFYWKIEPKLGANCWIPFDRVGRDEIALGIIPNSHEKWKLEDHETYYDFPAWGKHQGGVFEAFPRHRIPRKRIDDSKEVVLPMEAGDGLFFTNFTWHRSEPNRTGEDRMFYAISYRLKS